MTSFEDTLVVALRAEAEEISMSIDAGEAFDELSSRLDQAERSRTRTRWLAVAAGVAVVALVGAAATGLRAQQRDAAPALPAPSSAGEYSAPYFAEPFTATLPDWVRERFSTPTYESSAYSWWSNCPGASKSVCADLSISRFTSILSDYQSEVTYASYVAHLQSLGRDGTLSIEATTRRTVDGRPATEIAGLSLTEGDRVLGCALTECQNPLVDMRVRVVVVDMGTGKPPVVIWTEVSRDNPETASWPDQLDTVLQTIHFTG